MNTYHIHIDEQNPFQSTPAQSLNMPQAGSKYLIYLTSAG